MASDFILQIICRIHQIRNPKRPLFRIKSQKNDAIVSATLIAPEITSGIKPGMNGVTPQVSVHLNTELCTQIKLKRRMWEINSKRKGQIKVKLHKRN